MYLFKLINLAFNVDINFVEHNKSMTKVLSQIHLCEQEVEELVNLNSLKKTVKYWLGAKVLGSFEEMRAELEVRYGGE